MEEQQSLENQVIDTPGRKKYPRHKLTLKQRKMLKALESSLGIVTIACRSIGIQRQTHYDWLEKFPEYEKEYRKLDDLVLDWAENALHTLISAQDTAATIFLLKTKGKKRGYVERQEVTGADGKAFVAPVINISPITTVNSPDISESEEDIK